MYFFPFSKEACTIELIVPTCVSQTSNIPQTCLSSKIGWVLDKKNEGINSFEYFGSNGSLG